MLFKERRRVLVPRDGVVDALALQAKEHSARSMIIGCRIAPRNAASIAQGELTAEELGESIGVGLLAEQPFALLLSRRWVVVLDEGRERVLFVSAREFAADVVDLFDEQFTKPRLHLLGWHPTK